MFRENRGHETDDKYTDGQCATVNVPL